MSVSSDEINYMIWRYLQESGLEVSSYALDDETSISQIDKKLSKIIPFGCLIDLIQKGILYSKLKDISATKTVLDNDEIINMNFNLFSSFNEMDDVANRKIVKVKNEPSSTNTIGSTNNKGTDFNANFNANANSNTNDFIKVIKESMSFGSSYATSFSPILLNSFTYSQINKNESIIYNLDTKNQIKLPFSTNCKNQLLISYSPNGKLLIIANENGELHLWDPENGNLLSVFAMHQSPIVSIKWSPNGKYLLSLDIKNIIIVWDIELQSIFLYLDNDTINLKLKLNNLNTLVSNNTTIATQNNDLSYGTETCWLDDNKFIMPGSNFNLLVNQINNDGNHSIIGVLLGNENSISSIKYNKSLRLLCSSNDDGIIRIYKGNSINSLQIIIAHSLSISFIDWIKINNQWYILSTSLDGTIKIWDFFKNKLISLNYVFDSQSILISSLFKYKKFYLLATGDSSGSVYIWKIQESADENEVSIRQMKYYQHDDKTNATTSTPAITTTTTTTNISLTGYIADLSWNSNGSKLAVCYTVGSSAILDINCDGELDDDNDDDNDDNNAVDKDVDM